jgi:hypothetical protein
MRSQSGQVKLQNRKSSRTLSVFWSMKMTRSPTPVSDAIAPPLSRTPSACGLVLSSGPFWITAPPLAPTAHVVSSRSS